MKTIQCLQGSSLWLANRCGMITASRVAEILPLMDRTLKDGTVKEGGFPASRSGYLWELVTERITHDTADHYVSPWMERGTQLEDDARLAYGMVNGVLVEQVGLVVHPTMDFYRASPDGVVLPGGLELKVPKPETHLRWKDARVVPKEHEPQCMAQIDCCEFDWVDFTSYLPNRCKEPECLSYIQFGEVVCQMCGTLLEKPIPEDLQLFTVRLYRDEKRIEFIRSHVRRLNDEVEEALMRLKGISVVTEQLKASLEVV